MVVMLNDTLMTAEAGSMQRNGGFFRSDPARQAGDPTAALDNSSQALN